MTDTKKIHIEDVQPIKTREQLKDMKESLKRWCSQRDYILFLIGINTGLRVSDLLKLRTEDIRGKQSLKIKESKTSKSRTIYFNDNVYNEIQSYIDTNKSEWLFPSQKGNKAISSTQAYRQLKKAGHMVDMDYIGTHTMRKTFGYFHYQANRNIALLQDILNHSTPAVTLRYIGLSEEEKRDTSISLDL